MKLKDFKGFMVGGLVAASSLSVLAVVQIPNVFKPGDLITADGMNQNFSSLKAGIDALEIAANSKQSRVSGVCAAGSAVKQILADGTVSCETFPASGGVLLTDATLVGDGSNAAKLGVKLPLSLAGSSSGSTALVTIENSVGTGLSVQSQSGAAIVGISQTGDGVTAVSVDGAGLKVQSYNGFAIEARGNIKQDRDYYGLPKAMVFVRTNPTSGVYEIVRCFNSQQTGTLVYSGGCGIVLKPHTFDIDLDFGFNVSDRFVSITSTANFGMYASVGDTNTTSTIVTASYIGSYSTGAGIPKLSFNLIVY
jgi:competence protein ComGC